MTELTFRPAALRGDGTVLADWWHTVDRWSVAAVGLLFVLGIVLGLAASPPLAEKNGLWTYHYVIRHLIFAVLAIVLIVAASMAQIRHVRRGAILLFLLFWAGTALLPWLGTDFGKGATRWYSLGFASLQPSEFLKPGFIVAAAWLMAGAAERNGPPGRVISGFVAVAIAAMLALQPDFGQAMLLLAVWATMLFVSGAPLILLLGLGAAVGVAGSVAYFNSSHFAGRINGYLADEVAANTQLAYAQSAIREGGLYGVGAAQGSVKWTLPDAHTDFIIAVAAEEFGLILTLVIIAIYLFLVVRAMTRLLEERDVFIRLAGTGLAAALGLQAFINMSVAIRLLPAKGMTLPFISYGGSSMVAAALAMGALLALTRIRPQDPAASLRKAL